MENTIDETITQLESELEYYAKKTKGPGGEKYIAMARKKFNILQSIKRCACEKSKLEVENAELLISVAGHREYLSKAVTLLSAFGVPEIVFDSIMDDELEIISEAGVKSIWDIFDIKRGNHMKKIVLLESELNGAIAERAGL